MRARWNVISARWLFILILALACFVASIRKGMQYAGAAPTERTTTAYDVYMQYQTTLGDGTKSYSCSYRFSIGEVSYHGHENCPQPGPDDSPNGRTQDSSGVIQESNAMVYYDPANPSLNSLTEFSAKSRAAYRDAMLPVCICTIIILFAVMAMMLEATKSRETDWIFAQSEGTAIHPDEMDSGSEFGGLPGGSRRADEAFAAASDKAAKAAYFASSHGLRELYLDVVRQVHPDHANNEADRILRERLTKEANAAFRRGDDATLRRVLEEYRSTISETCQHTI